MCRVSLSKYWAQNVYWYRKPSSSSSSLIELSSQVYNCLLLIFEIDYYLLSAEWRPIQSDFNERSALSGKLRNNFPVRFIARFSFVLISSGSCCSRFYLKSFLFHKCKAGTCFFPLKSSPDSAESCGMVRQGVMKYWHLCWVRKNYDFSGEMANLKCTFPSFWWARVNTGCFPSLRFLFCRRRWP